jgi:hypothetical protein
MADARAGRVPWRKWGPYLSERQWGPFATTPSEQVLTLGKVTAVTEQTEIAI